MQGLPLRAAAAATAALLLAGACSPRVSTHGRMVEAARLEEIRPGVTHRDDVAQILGSPTAFATFDERTWYYIGEVQQASAFFKPRATERRVVVVRFDDAWLVEAVEERGLEDGNDVAVVSRTTPTPGRELTFMQQLLGNIGRFPAGGLSPSGQGGPPRL
jgi:outer membrane protein assembly factor BamE (lipoprotein component of BamABCDE complex)